MGTFASDLEKKLPSHNLSMNMHAITAITKSEKANFNHIVAKSDDKHCNIRYDVLVIVSGYSLMVGNIHMWSQQKLRSKEEKKLMMI